MVCESGGLITTIKYLKLINALILIILIFIHTICMYKYLSEKIFIYSYFSS